MWIPRAVDLELDDYYDDEQGGWGREQKARPPKAPPIARAPWAVALLGVMARANSFLNSPMVWRVSRKTRRKPKS